MGSVYDPNTKTFADVLKTGDLYAGPAQGIRYYYYVQPYAADGTPLEGESQQYVATSRMGKPASIVLTNVSLKKPAISKITAGKAKATVSWKKVAGASKYYVYYSTKKNSGYTFAGITTKTKLSVTGLTSGKKYYFKVKACKANEVGADVYSALSAAKSKKVK